MNTTDKIMALITDFGAASLRLGSYERKDSYESSAKASWQTIAFREKREVARQAVRAEIEALARDAEELAFLKNDLLSRVDRAVEKGNANSDIQEASERYDQWLKTRHAAMQEKQS